MNTLQPKKTIIGVIALVLILLVIPITLYLSQQEQDIRQQAAGTPVYSPPASYNTWKGYCYEETPLVSGLRGCVTQRGFNGKAYGWVRNTTTSQTFTVGMASYKAYIPYPNPWPSCDIHVCPEQHEWLWTQTYHDGVTASVRPGQTVYFEVSVPTNCAWQTDVFKGNIMHTFTKPNGYYGGQGLFIDGWYETSLPMCQKTTPTPTRVPIPTPTKIPTPTPTRVPTPTPTRLPTPTPTRPPTPTPTRPPTPTPTRIPTPTATPIPRATTFSLTVLLHGIGNSGDNANPTQHSLSNKNPLRKSRVIQMEIYNSSDSLILSRAGTLTYDSSSGSFKGTVDLGTSLMSGSYIIRVKSPYYLKRRVSGIQSITAGSQQTLSPITLVTGDINNDNVLSILDYNILIGCYSDFGPPISCTASQKQQSDITDDGNVDQFDYNLFLRDFSVQLGD